MNFAVAGMAGLMAPCLISSLIAIRFGSGPGLIIFFILLVLVFVAGSAAFVFNARINARHRNLMFESMEIKNRKGKIVETAGGDVVVMDRKAVKMLRGSSAFKVEPLKDLKPVENLEPEKETEQFPDFRSKISETVFKTLKPYGIEFLIVKEIEAPQLVRHIGGIGPNQKVSQVANLTKELQIALGCRMEPVVSSSADGVCLDVPRDNPDLVTWESMAGLFYPGDTLQFPIGLDVYGKVVTADLANPASPHMLLAGSSGSGKSKFLEATVASIARFYPDRVRFMFVDPKLVTFGGLGKSSLLCEGGPGGILTDSELIAEGIDFLCGIMDERYQMLMKSGMSCLTDARRSGFSTLPYIVLVIDEYAEVVSTCDQQVQTDLQRLSSKGRAAGIHIILATQRPDKKVVNGNIKANFPMGVCLRVTNRYNSDMVVGTGGGERLIGNGDGLLNSVDGLIRFQTPFINSREFVGVMTGGSSPGPPTARKKELISLETDESKVMKYLRGRPGPVGYRTIISSKILTGGSVAYQQALQKLSERGMLAGRLSGAWTKREFRISG